MFRSFRWPIDTALRARLFFFLKKGIKPWTDSELRKMK